MSRDLPPSAPPPSAAPPPVPVVPGATYSDLELSNIRKVCMCVCMCVFVWVGGWVPIECALIDTLSTLPLFTLLPTFSFSFLCLPPFSVSPSRLSLPSPPSPFPSTPHLEGDCCQTFGVQTDYPPLLPHY